MPYALLFQATAFFFLIIHNPQDQYPSSTYFNDKTTKKLVMGIRVFTPSSITMISDYNNNVLNVAETSNLMLQCLVFRESEETLIVKAILSDSSIWVKADIVPKA